MVVNLEDVVHRYRVRQARAQIVGQGRSEKSGSSVSSEKHTKKRWTDSNVKVFLRKKT